jgi:hypothetical protein
MSLKGQPPVSLEGQVARATGAGRGIGCPSYLFGGCPFPVAERKDLWP